MFIDYQLAEEKNLSRFVVSFEGINLCHNSDEKCIPLCDIKVKRECLFIFEKNENAY